MIILGLTGSIGMGKSTVGAMLNTLGVAVHEADHAVHALLTQEDSPARAPIEAAFPRKQYPALYKTDAGFVCRKAFGQLVFGDDAHMATLESILHPLVRADQDRFIAAEQRAGRAMVALDIPLLFETGADARVDYTITVSAPAFMQKQRVLARPNMTEGKLKQILARQMPDEEKCARSDYVVKTGLGRAHSMAMVKHILADIRGDDTVADASKPRAIDDLFAEQV